MKKSLKKIGLAITTILLTFMLLSPNLLAAGIYVDEDANPVTEEGVNEEEQNQPQEPAIEQPVEQPVQKQEEQAVKEAETKTEEVKINPVEGQSNPFIRKMEGLMQGTLSIDEMNISQGGKPRNTRGTTLNIGGGTIVISSAGYTQNGSTHLNPSGEYFIEGATNSNSIIVEDGNITITLVKGSALDFSINLTDPNSDNIPALQIKPEATVNLLVGSNSTCAPTLKGGKYASGIQVERGATLNVSGSGTLYAIGGIGGAGIGGNTASPVGGRLVFANQSARVIAYSDNAAGAINMSNVSASMAKLIHGMLDASEKNDGAEQTVIIDNRDSATESYTLKIPAGYTSFAVTTTAAGGEYISYRSGDQLNHKLFGTSSGAHVFNLLNANEIATLSGLTSQEIRYKVTFHANSGKFGSSGGETIYTEILYGSTVTQPEEPVKNENNSVEGWYRSIEGTSRWNFNTDKIVRDTTLYVKWKPTKCLVTFVGGYKDAPVTNKTYNYQDSISQSDLPRVDNQGKVLKGWYTNTTPSVKWDFSNDQIEKEFLTLTAVWLNEYTVTFKSGTTETVQGMPGDTKVTEGMTLQNISTPTRDRWEFTGWYTDSNATKPWNTSNDTVKANTTLYAGWAVKLCTVSYETGEGGSQVSDESVGYKREIPKPQNVTKTPRDGTMPTTYSVEGWYTDAAFTKKWDFTTELVSKTDTFTLYAKWHQDNCYVTFDGDGGTTVDAGGDEVGKITKKYDYKDPAVDPIFTREGYDLAQWNRGNVRYDMATLLTEDIELKAVWRIKSYNVTFDSKGGGQTPAPKTIQYAAKIPAVTAPKKPGYVFEGWYTKEAYDADSKWDFATSTMPAKNITLYAKWLPIEYTVYYERDGGLPDPLPEDSLEYDSKIGTKPAEMTKAHYEFDGWYTKADFTGIKWNFDTNVIGDAGDALVEDEDTLTGILTLYAKWKPETYEVIFDTSRASCVKGEDVPELLSAEKKQKVVYNNAVNRPAYPEVEWKGHTLVGWYLDPDDEDTKWAFGDEETPQLIEQDETLYAKWQCNEYRVSYVESYEEPVDSGVLYHYGELVQAPSDPPVRENYEFEAWYTDEERSEGHKWNFTKNKIEQDMILYANYLGEPRKLNVYITYEEGNSKYDQPIKQVKDVRYGDKLEITDIVNEENQHTKKRPGYTINGWTIDQEASTFWDFENDRIGGSTGEETNLYGWWTRDEYEIKFVTYEDDPNPIPSQVCWYEMKAVKPNPDPIRTHYQFDGWYKEDTFENPWDFENDLIYGHTTIYAKWKPNIYKLLFETNGGSKLESIDVEYGTLIPEDALGTKKEGYYIDGWYRDASFTQPFDITKDLVDKDKMTLYTKWELNRYTVKYHITDETTNEEVIETDPKTYHIGNKLAKPAYPKAHKTLSAWYQDQGYQEKWVFKRDTVKGDTTLYAYWSDTLYKVHFETYGGTDVQDLELVWGSQFEAPQDPEKTGYTFTGWYANSTYTTLWDFEEDFVDGDTNIYAGWSPNSYTVTFDGDGGGPVPDPMTLPFGSLIPKPEDPAKEGFTFEGWKPSTGAAAEGAWNFETDTMPEDFTLAATWKAIEPPAPDPAPTPPAPTPTSDVKAASSTDGGGVSQAVEQLKGAVDNLAKVMTGDDAPLLWSLVGVMLSAVAILRIFIKRMK